MKPLYALTLAAFITANPIPLILQNDAVKGARIESRATGLTSKEFTRGGCRDIIFIYARGSTQLGNMGDQPGPQTSDGLKRKYGDRSVATEGVDYPALLTTNLEPGGADPRDAAVMKKLLTDAATKCPGAKIVAGGYSQGGAMGHRAIEGLSDDVKSRIVGVVFFGDTQNQQDRGQIPKFPKGKVKIICNGPDDICRGTLNVKPAHLDYAKRAPEAVDFLVGKIGSA
ncbi:putative cutinase 1 [Colletotrichum spinosum]|uniref:Cutinase n=1 Tax=Colletotrichum spinosum TaxID=1347390 RepID=A0A4R8QI37_9PEZI|nr:putative cutinase 1 [Colletotrichum spinosum]